MDAVNIGKTQTLYNENMTLTWFQLVYITWSDCTKKIFSENLNTFRLAETKTEQKQLNYCQNMAKDFPNSEH